MRTKKFRFCAVLLSMLLLLSLFGCSSSTNQTDSSSTDDSTTAGTTAKDADTEEEVTYDDSFAQDIKEKGYLTVGCKTDVPDLSYYDEETKTWSGLEVELAYKTAANLFDTDVETAKEKELVHFVGVTVSNREKTLQDGDIDCMMATYTDTEQREKTFSVSESYYTDYIGIMVTTKGESTNSLGTRGEIKSIANLDGKYVGIPSNATTREDMIEYINTMNQLKTSPIFCEYGSYEKLFKALKNGDIDAMAVDVSILNGYVDGNTKILNDRFASQHYVAAVQKGNESLLPYINEAIEQ